jgi:hypothetical protein
VDAVSGAELQAGGALGATRLDREDPDTRRRAARFVATQARDADDCALLLDALGLRPEEGTACR